MYIFYKEVSKKKGTNLVNILFSPKEQSAITAERKNSADAESRATDLNDIEI